MRTDSLAPSRDTSLASIVGLAAWFALLTAMLETAGLAGLQAFDLVGWDLSIVRVPPQAVATASLLDLGLFVAAGLVLWVAGRLTRRNVMPPRFTCP